MSILSLTNGDVWEDEFVEHGEYKKAVYREHIVRAFGVAISTSQVVVAIPLPNPNSSAENLPSWNGHVTVVSAAMTGIGTVTAEVDTTRTNSSVIAFDLTKSGTTFTNHYCYLCQVDFILSE